MMIKQNDAKEVIGGAPFEKMNENEALYFDPNELYSCAGPALSSVQQYLDNAIDAAPKDVPDDFEYKADLNPNIPIKLNQCKNDTKSLQTWIIDDVIIPMLELEGANEEAINNIKDIFMSGGVAVTLPTETLYIIPGTREAFDACGAALLRMYHDEGWTYANDGKLVYGGINSENTFEDVINNPWKVTCCATFVSTVLYLSGWADTEDFYFKNNDGSVGFNPNYQANTMKVLENLGCETIKMSDGYDALEPNDIMFYWDSEGTLCHVDIYAGRDENGTHLARNCGSDNGISAGTATPKSFNGTYWVAVRLPESKSDNAKPVSIPNPNYRPNKDKKPSGGPGNGGNGTPSVPGNIEPLIKECTPEAVLEAAQTIIDMKEDTTYSEYISFILHKAGYIPTEQLEQYCKYDLETIQEQLEMFGWESILDKEELQAGDMLFIENEEGGTVQIYAGDDKWYTLGSNDAQLSDFDWTGEWKIYRPSEGRTTITL